MTKEVSIKSGEVHLLVFAICCGSCISIHQTRIHSPVPHPPIHIVEKSDELVLELKPRLDVNLDGAFETAVDRSGVNNATWQLPRAQIGLDGSLSMSVLQLSAGLGYARVEERGYPYGTIELGARPGSRGTYLGLGLRWRKSWSETDYTYSSSMPPDEAEESRRLVKRADDYLSDLYFHFSHNTPEWGDTGGFFMQVELGFMELLRFRDMMYGEEFSHAKRMGSISVGTYRTIDTSRRVVGGLRVTRFADRHLPEIVAQVDWKVGRLRLGR